jgi:ABC-type glycerol-3-phosphate transport system permease component
MRLGFWEYFLIQLALFTAIWLWNDYVGTLISLIWGTLCLFILLISLLVELIERSKVPKIYFGFMIASVLAALFSALIYLFIIGELDWMQRL